MLSKLIELYHPYLSKDFRQSRVFKPRSAISILAITIKKKFNIMSSVTVAGNLNDAISR